MYEKFKLKTFMGFKFLRKYDTVRDNRLSKCLLCVINRICINRISGSNRRRCSVEKVVLINFAMFTEMHLC